LFRLAAKAAKVNPEEAFEALIPAQWSRLAWPAGSVFSVRIVADPAHRRQTEAFLTALREGRVLGEGEFILGQSLELEAMIIPNPDLDSASDDSPADKDLEELWPPLSEESLLPEIEALTQISPPWRLILETPLRLTRPATAPGFLEYAGIDFFAWPKALAHLISRIRLSSPDSVEDLDLAIRPNKLAIMSVSVKWSDLAYSRERKMRLGGLTGSILIDGVPDRADARRLVWGQYLGVGKNARFGFGFYRIPTLDPIRRLPLYPQPGQILGDLKS
jgi:hypothetical protein